MTLNVETVLAVSVLLSVFAAIAAIGSSLVLGAGFERLRAGFEAIASQTNFFGDKLNKLEKKVETVDSQTAKSIRTLELQVIGITDQANIFAGSIQELAEKVENMESQPTVDNGPEPANPVANIQRYFNSDARNILIAAGKEKELKRKKSVKAKMHAIAREIDGPSPLQEHVADMSQFAVGEETHQIRYH
jgi:hypothetical protein